MPDIPVANTFAALQSLHGKPVPVAVFALMADRHRHSIYRRIERGTLPACYVGGLLCVLVNGEGGQPVTPSPALPRALSARPLSTAGNHASSRERAEQTEQMKAFNKFAGVAAVLGLAGGSAMAQAVGAPDPTTLITSATSAANSVMGVCITVGGFFLVYKIVKWIRK